MKMGHAIVVLMALSLVCMISYAADFDSDVAIMEQIASGPIERELVESGRYELFKTVRDIYRMAVDLHARMRTPVTLSLVPKPMHIANAGSDLRIVFDEWPIDLCMLWGRLSIGEISKNDKYEAQEKRIKDIFFQKLTLAFESNSGEKKYRHDNPFITPSCQVKFYREDDEKGRFYEVAEDELQGYKGTYTKITTDLGGCFSCYKILAVEGRLLPEQKIREVEKHRSIEDIKNEWDTLTTMYYQEQTMRWKARLAQAQGKDNMKKEIQ